jgi:hypothetical protein
MIYIQFLLIYNVAELLSGINHIHIHINKNPHRLPVHICVDNWGRGARGQVLGTGTGIGRGETKC